MIAYQMHLLPSLPAIQVKEVAPAYPETEATVGVTFAVSADPIISFVDEVAREWWDRLTPGQQQLINGRFERALAIAKTKGAVEWIAEDDDVHFRVRSVTTKGNYFYDVMIAEDCRLCTCPDYENAPHNACKHVLAAYFTKLAKGLVVDTPAELKPTPKEQENLPWQVEALFQSRDFASALVYADASYMQRVIAVEVLWIAAGTVGVKALPLFSDGKPVGYFPFPAPDKCCLTRWSYAELPVIALSNIRIYRSKG